MKSIIFLFAFFTVCTAHARDAGLDQDSSPAAASTTSQTIAQPRTNDQDNDDPEGIEAALYMLAFCIMQ